MKDNCENPELNLIVCLTHISTGLLIDHMLKGGYPWRCLLFLAICLSVRISPSLLCAGYKIQHLTYEANHLVAEP